MRRSLSSQIKRRKSWRGVFRNFHSAYFSEDVQGSCGSAA